MHSISVDKIMKDSVVLNVLRIYKEIKESLENDTTGYYSDEDEILMRLQMLLLEYKNIATVLIGGHKPTYECEYWVTDVHKNVANENCVTVALVQNTMTHSLIYDISHGKVYVAVAGIGSVVVNMSNNEVTLLVSRDTCFTRKSSIIFNMVRNKECYDSLDNLEFNRVLLTNNYIAPPLPLCWLAEGIVDIVVLPKTSTDWEPSLLVASGVDISCWDTDKLRIISTVSDVQLFLEKINAGDAKEVFQYV